MTNNQFWSKLNTIAKKTQTPVTTAELTDVLAQGYFQDLELIISCADDTKCPGYSFQSYIDTELGRLMLCYTSYAHAENEKRHLPIGDSRTTSYATAKCQDVLDNVLYKPVIAGLAFNSDCFNTYIIPKEFLRMVLLDTMRI